MIERPEEAVLVQAVADIPVVFEARDVVDDRILPQRRDLLMGEIEALHDQRPLIHAVPPVLLHAVARADGDEAMGERFRRDFEGPPGRLREGDRRAFDHALSGREHMTPLGPPEPLRLAGGILPDPHRFLERTLSLVSLVENVEDGVVVELHRRIVPHARHLAFRAADAGGLGLADRTDPPGAIPRPLPAIARNLEDLVADGERSLPRPGLGEPHRVEEDPAVLANVLSWLLECRDCPLPDDVEGESVFAWLEH